MSSTKEDQSDAVQKRTRAETEDGGCDGEYLCFEILSFSFSNKWDDSSRSRKSCNFKHIIAVCQFVLGCCGSCMPRLNFIVLQMQAQSRNLEQNKKSQVCLEDFILS